MPNWTTQQKAAIEDEGGTLLLSASAGSGKTAVLVERAFRLISAENPTSADRLLILTFSNAAAAELRSRIAQRLDHALEQDPGSMHLRRQKMLLQRAQISTVSAFCMQLLREQFSRLPIPPDFRVADESIRYELSQATLAAVLEASYESPAFREFASVFGKARNDRAAGDAVLGLYEHLRALPFFETSLSSMCALFHGEEAIEESLWGKELLKGAGEVASEGIAVCNAALDIIRETPELAGYADALLIDRDCFLRLQELLEQKRWDDARIAAGYQPVKLKSVRGFDGTEKETVQALRKQAKELLGDILSDYLVCSAEQFEEDRAALAPMVDALADAVRMYSDRFFEAKVSEKVLEFSDFEHLTLQLLVDENGKKTPLAKEISARYDVVMVDEYQDTNALQDMLYRMLANEDESNLFLVGDVKQSIYRFRKAMPELFIDKKERFAPYDGKSHPASLILPHNFRSTEAVVSGINDLFCALMCREVGEITYDGAEKLIAGAGESPAPGGVEIDLINISENKEFGEAEAVAQRIRSMVREGFLVREKDGTLRPCNYGDFCILMRSPAGSGELYLTALEAHGVPATADLDTAMLTEPAVQPIIAALRVLDNPAQDVPLAAVMTSPMFAFSGAELAALRAKTPRGGLWMALRADDTEKTQRFLSTILTLRREGGLLPVAALTNRLLEETGYLLCAQVADAADVAAGAARLGALRSFLAFAGEYDASSGAGLAGFLRRIDSSLASGRSVSNQGAAAPQGMVQIMSIHRSKGLEFPVCILADTAHGFNRQDLNVAPVLRHTALGIGMTLRTESGARYPTVPQKALRSALEREQMSEEMRVLYVALTRAKDLAIITCGAADPEKVLGKLAIQLAGAGGITPWMLRTAKSFSEWILAAALLHPDGGEFRAAASAATLPLQVAEGKLSVRILAAPLHEECEQKAQLLRTAEPDESLVMRLRKAFHWHYPRAELLELPAKVSVSALTHRIGEASVPKRPSFMYGSGLSATERGTALHAALQYVNFLSLQRDTEAEITRLVNSGFILPEQAAAIDRRALSRFLESDIFRSMCMADKVLREYAFFTHLPASMLKDGLPDDLQDHQVLVQGIADCVLLFGDEAVLLDYKTDRGKDEAALRRAYTAQLLLYKQAVEAGLGVRVRQCCIYSFALGKAIEIAADTPLPALQK